MRSCINIIQTALTVVLNSFSILQLQFSRHGLDAGRRRPGIWSLLLIFLLYKLLQETHDDYFGFVIRTAKMFENQ